MDERLKKYTIYLYGENVLCNYAKNISDNMYNMIIDDLVLKMIKFKKAF